MQQDIEIPTLRRQGHALFDSVRARFPLPFMVCNGSRHTLRLLPQLAGFPPIPRGPWYVDQVVEDGNTLELGYHGDERWVEYYIGFFEALVAHFGERAFIAATARRDHFSIRMSFAA